MNPDQMGPIVRNTPDGRRQLVHARWGLPSPFFVQKKAAEDRAAKLKAKGQTVEMDELLRMEPDRGLTNVRKLNLPHWKRWFGVEHRCLVPVTSFAEPDPASQEPGGSVPNAWFARDESKPLMFFAGVHVPEWQSVRKVKDGLTTDDLYGFLTTDPNEVVQPVHEKAMPVLLLIKEDTDLAERNLGGSTASCSPGTERGDHDYLARSVWIKHRQDCGRTYGSELPVRFQCPHHRHHR